MCIGTPKVAQVVAPPLPVPPPPPPAPVTITAPPVLQQGTPEQKKQVRPTTAAAKRRSALGGVTGKRKFTIPLGGYGADRKVSSQSTGVGG